MVSEPAGTLSLSTAGARNLATTTKSNAQMQGISPRWLLRSLPWVEVPAGAYRVNRRASTAAGSGRVGFYTEADAVRIVPPSLAELPVLRGFDDPAVLAELAGRFTPQDFAAGDTVVTAGEPIERIVLIAQGKVRQLGVSQYGDERLLGTVADGEALGTEVLTDDAPPVAATAARAVTAVTALVLSRADARRVLEESESLREHLAELRTQQAISRNRHGEVEIDIGAGHAGEPDLPGTYAAYEVSPREYELSVAQTVLRVHSRVADLFNDPIDQVEEQVRLTVEALRERQESELLNNREFGLLHNVDLKQRIHTRSGPPTPDDMDELVSRRRKTKFFFAHPRAIAAFHRECTAAGVYPQEIEVDGRQVSGWRGVPMLPCDKIPVSATGTTQIVAMRTGEENQGVIGLAPPELPDQYQPGVSVRTAGVSDKGIVSYEASVYYSVAVLVPDALGVLENVELGR